VLAGKLTEVQAAFGARVAGAGGAWGGASSDGATMDSQAQPVPVARAVPGRDVARRSQGAEQRVTSVGDHGRCWPLRGRAAVLLAW